jgi:adenine-specific DNA-methyltransferase
MPTLHWVGKEKVVNHHHDVPFRVLNKEYSFRANTGLPPPPRETNTTDNRIIHGDNLEALKSLLPEFEGRVKCIYIDPPYNTGNEEWRYNDAVNDPKMKRWLGQVVGKEGEDLSRHDKWLCMMYPRLKLLHRMLHDDGSIWVSIDDNASGLLRPLLDEIFGGANFVATVIWEKADSPRNSARQFSTDHDYILVYSKKPGWTPARLPRNEESDAIYQNQDDDERGPWIPGDPFANKPYSKGLYTIAGPTGREFSPPAGRYWRVSEEKLRELDQDGRIWWGPKGDARPSIKRYLNEVADLVPRTLWTKEAVGSNRSSKNEQRAIFAGDASFDTPKPSALIERVIQIAASPNDIVLDSFAGSGTTGHAVLKLNAQDSGTRRFVMVETESYADTLTAERIRRVMVGYGDGAKATGGLGGGFDYYTVGEPIFLPDQNLNEAVGTEAIRGYVAYSEGIPPDQRTTPENPHTPYLLGLNRDTAWIFHYEPDRPTSLDMDFLSSLRFGGDTGNAKPGTVIIYADRCLLAKDFMTRHGIIFKKIPRDITRF